MKPLIQLKKTTPLFIIALLLACFGLVPLARAVVPPPDGGYPNFTTAEGQNALFNLTTGAANTAVGWFSLFSDTAGSFNTATGAGTLLFNTADNNTAFGAASLLFNTTGTGNTATGTAALLNNTEGFLNTADGAFALSSNSTGAFNTATGNAALFSNTTGSDNTAIGNQALGGNLNGNDNTAIGLSALASNTTGSNNVALGRNAGVQQTTGSNNIYIGTLIGGAAGENDSCYIGSIFNQLSSGGTAVFVNANHKLGTMTSSQRFKQEIKPMQQTSEVLYALKPVTFRYKKEIDAAGTSQFGLVAEDVEKVNPGLVVRDKEGKPYSVRYDQVNAMLLNEFLKEHRKVEALKNDFQATLARQQKQIEALTAQLKEQAAQIQNMNAQLEISNPAPSVALKTP
jgi:Chaperone of endosialidase